MNREVLRNIIFTQSTLASLITEFNKTSDDVQIISNRDALLVSGIEKIADYYGYDVDSIGDIKFINLMGITVLEGPNETLRDSI